MIELAEAQQFVFERVSALAPTDCSLEEATGCVLAETVVAQEALPGFTNSSMDGFALRAADTSRGGSRLRVVETIHAGDVPIEALQPGHAARIMTGAPLPEGADCVCMVEEVTIDGEFVVIPRELQSGQFVRQIGEDTVVGQMLFSPGTPLDAPAIGVLAGQGYRSVRVYRRPRVGVLSTGNELVDSGARLAPGQIRDLNRPLLLALIAQSGFLPVDLGTVRDTPEAIARALSEGVQSCDGVVSTGGVSVGDADFVKSVIGEMSGGEARWMQVAIKPGKPFAFGVVGPERTPVFGLPGNPVSTRVNFEVFVRPALRKMAGHRRWERLVLDAVLDVDIDRPADGKLHLVHVRVQMNADGRLHVRSATRRGSHMLSAIVGANAIALVPMGHPSGLGDSVHVLILNADTLTGTG